MGCRRIKTYRDDSSDLTYIFDYTRNKLIYPDDLKMLIKINKLAFDFFYTLKPEQKKYVNIVYDIPHEI